ncbi:hypothetical protein [Streptomyces olivaceoviridis]
MSRRAASSTGRAELAVVTIRYAPKPEPPAAHIRSRRGSRSRPCAWWKGIGAPARTSEPLWPPVDRKTCGLPPLASPPPGPLLRPATTAAPVPGARSMAWG